MSRRAGRVRSKEDGWGVWGGYMNAKKQKLKEQFDKEAPQQLKKEGSGSKIFSGVSIHVNGYTKPSSDELKRLMMLHGGSYEHYLYRTRVTHVIATNLPNSKVRELKGLKVVRPEWITESIAAGKLLNYTNYLLYTAQSGLQTGLKSFSVTGNTCNQSSDVTVLNGKPSLSAMNSTTQSFNEPSSSASVPTMSRHETMEKENIARNSSVQNNQTSEISPSKSHDETQTFGKSFQSHSKPMATAGDANFLNEFYSNSRLHFLSVWKAEFKAYVNELQKQGTSFPGRDRLRKVVEERDMLDMETDIVGGSGKAKRCVMHVDMDCFFVSVGLRNRPDLKGKPVAVTHSKGKGTTPDPESDLYFEKSQWELRRMTGGKKGKRTGNHSLQTDVNDDLSFPDKSDSEDEEDGNNANKSSSSVAMTTNEAFHSMAEIASCSYEARQRGVKNGMFMGKAKTICPELLTIPYDFEQYKAVSKILYDTVASYSHDIEAVSCDEMLVDCTELLADTGASPSEFATLLRDEIFHKTGCCASAGLASNILLAKMATRKAKPNGQFHLPCDLINDFIKPQSVKDIPGVGWSLTKRLEALKVLTCGELQRVSMETLQKEFGPKTGESLYRYCRGEDDRSVKVEQQRKSVSAEVNYGIRFNNDGEAHKFIQDLSLEVCTRLHNIQMKGKTITLKLMIRREDAPKATSKFMGHGICNNFSKSVTLPMATDDCKIVGQECLSILKQQRCDPSDLRGIGIQIQKLEPSVIGNQSGLPKNQSILNFTINKNNSETSNRVPPKISDYSGSKVSVNPTQKDVCRKDVNNTISELKATVNEVSENNHTASKHHYSVTDGTRMNQKEQQSNNRTDAINDNGVSEVNTEKGFVIEDAVDGGDSDEMEDMVVDPPSSTDVIVGEIGATSSDLLKDLGRRQIVSSLLPPLPCLPDLKSPVNPPRTEYLDVSTPKTGQNSGPSFTAQNELSQQTDYFPSPSQIDPEVLKELPQEIRLQVEKEMETRKKSAHRISRSNSGQGCSHWQPDKGGHSNSSAVSKGDQSECSEDTESHVESDIVPLPSSSQLDLSCLNALPESLQDEIRQAYAVQGKQSKVNNTGVSMMNLQQAKSPSKSPNKRSPSKQSPQFKVPKGKPSARGRKKGSSKKLVFKDQQRQDWLLEEQKVEQRLTSTVVNNEALEDVQTVPNDTPKISHNAEETTEPVINSNDSTTTGDTDASCLTQVSLCGAVKIVEVRNLIKEWVSSTPVPQTEDEEVFLEYIVALVRDKNLEQVDLVLKSMYRNINKSENLDWLAAFKRILTQTQSIVKHYHGYRLCTISI